MLPSHTVPTATCSLLPRTPVTPLPVRSQSRPRDYMSCLMLLYLYLTGGFPKFVRVDLRSVPAVVMASSPKSTARPPSPPTSTA